MHSKINDPGQIKLWSGVKTNRRHYEKSAAWISRVDIEYRPGVGAFDVIALAAVSDWQKQCVPAFDRIAKKRQVTLFRFQSLLCGREITKQGNATPDIARQSIAVRAYWSIRTYLPAHTFRWVLGEYELIGRKYRAESDPVSGCLPSFIVVRAHADFCVTQGELADISELPIILHRRLLHILQYYNLN